MTPERKAHLRGLGSFIVDVRGIRHNALAEALDALDIAEAQRDRLLATQSVLAANGPRSHSTSSAGPINEWRAALAVFAEVAKEAGR